MFKRMTALLLTGILLMTMIPLTLAEGQTPPPETTPAPETSAEPEATVSPTPLPTNKKGEVMELDDWYKWYYGEVLGIPNGNYKAPIIEIEGAVQFDEYNLPESIGEQYPLKTIADFDKNSPAIYTCMLEPTTSAYTERTIYMDRLFRTGTAKQKADVLYLDPLWAIVRWRGQIGYVKRHRILDVTPVDKDTTPAYGVQKHQYVAVTKDTAEVRIGMSHEDKCWAILKPGTTLTIWKFEGEWAVVNYWRTYGYIHVSDLGELRMVSPTDEPLSADAPIAAYTSYYKVNSTESIQNRMVNIDLGIQRMSIVLQPGQIADANALMGPYSLENGYLEAGALVDGGTTLSPGGGTCQVSSTLYNVLLQLPGVGILYRRAHGDNGAPYLPMGVDAAVGNSSLNLRFKNNYDFAIRLEGHTNYDGALCWLIYKVTE